MKGGGIVSLLKVLLSEGKKYFFDGESLGSKYLNRKTDTKENKKNCSEDIFTNDNVYQKFINEIHPKQIVFRLDEKPFMFYEIKYQYTTTRGNNREGTKYFIFNTYSPQINTKEELIKWIEEFNKENPNRKLLNVKFLKSKCLGYVIL